MTPEPDLAQLERAWRALAKPDWPDVATLRAHWVKFGLIRAMALTAPVASPPSPAARAAGGVPVPRAPAPFSARMAAAGEYLHPEE